MNEAQGLDLPWRRKDKPKLARRIALVCLKHGLSTHLERTEFPLENRFRCILCGSVYGSVMPPKKKRKNPWTDKPREKKRGT